MYPRTCDVISFVKSIGKETNAEAIVGVSSHGVLMSPAGLHRRSGSQARERINGGDIRRGCKEYGVG